MIPAMRTVQINTDLMVPAERLDIWRAGILQTFGPMHIEVLEGSAIVGRLKTTSRDGLSFHSMLYRGLSIWRKPEDVAHLTTEYFTLTRPISGLLRVTQDGEERQLKAGRMYLFNHSVVYRTTPDSEYETVSVAIPGEALRQRIPSLASFCDLSASCGENGGPQLIAAMAQHLAEGVSGWTDHEYATLTDQLLDLIGLFMRAPQGLGSSSESSTRAGHRLRAIRHIKNNATDPELTPAAVAQACGISLSYLHEVFRSTDLSVEGKIFEERLEISRRLMIDPGNVGVSVATLAYQAGFGDAAHFSRAFKRRYGITPGELRRHSLDRLQTS